MHSYWWLLFKKNEKQKNTPLSEVTKFNSKIVDTEVKINTSSTHSWP
jgi:hypothetical protein